MRYIILAFLGLALYAGSAYYFQEFNRGYVANLVALAAGLAGGILMFGSLIVAFCKKLTASVNERSDSNDVITEPLVKAEE